MKKLIRESEAAGKVVESTVRYDEYMAVLFTDDTALLTHAATGYDDEGAELEVITEIGRHDRYDLLQLGIITREALVEFNAKAKQKRQEAAEVRELNELKRLQEKYGE